MLIKRVKLVFVEYHPDKLESGMICYSKLDKSKSYYYRLADLIDLKNESHLHQPVHPYIIDEYDNFDTDINSLFLFSFKNNSEPVVANFDDLIGHELDDAKLIIAEHDQIAYVEKNHHLYHDIQSKKCFDIFDDDRNEFLDKILKNNGSCYILCKDEFTHPEEYTDVSWGDGKTKIVLKDNKVIIYP
jgi:hypothetical protein